MSSQTKVFWKRVANALNMPWVALTISFAMFLCVGRVYGFHIESAVFYTVAILAIEKFYFDRYGGK